MVRRGAKVSRATQLSPYPPRARDGRTFSNRPSLRPADNLFNSSSLKHSCIHLECRLPINLRTFLAEQLGATVNESDDAVLDLAAGADEATLSKLARAIRRYSTARARERWEECTIALEELSATASNGATLCLGCRTMDFSDSAARHRPPECVVLNLSIADRSGGKGHAQEATVADTVRSQIEEFRRLRAGFGLPHFELDCYVRRGAITFTWRPLT